MPGSQRFHRSSSGTHVTRRVGRWLLADELGRGSYGVVHLAWLDAGGEPVALKMFRALGEGDEEALARFEQEAQIAARLTHPGLVRVIDAGRHAGLPWMAMEYCQGPTLQDRLRAGPLPPFEGAGLVAEVARAVAHAHAHGVVHRDIKPANVILDLRAGGRPRLTDFGLALDRVHHRSLTATGDVVGTPYYMAPEQVRGDPIDAQADVWALGVVLYQCLSGQRPFQGQTGLEVARAILEHDPSPPSTHVPAIPPALDAVCLRALRRPRRERWASAQELAEAIERALATPSGAWPAQARARPRQDARRALVSGLVALLGSSAAASLALVWLSRPPAPPAARPDVAARDEAGLRAAVEQVLARGPSEATARLLAAERAASDQPDLQQRLRLERAARLWARGDALGVLELLPQPLPPGAPGLTARWLRAAALDELGQGRAAEAELEALAAAAPEDAPGLTAAAALQRRRAEGDGLALLEQALARAPEYRPARLLRLRGWLEDGGPLADAREELEALERGRASALELELVQLRLLLARRRGDQDALRRGLGQGVALSPGEPPRSILLLRGLQRLHGRDPGGARSDGLELLRRWQEDPGGALLVALSDLASRRDPPLSAARAALESDPRQTRALLLAGPLELSEALLQRLSWAPAPPPAEPGPALRRRLAARAAAAAPPARQPLEEALLLAAGGADWEALAAALDRARVAAPDDPVVLLECARTCAGRDLYEPAEAAIERSLAAGAVGPATRAELLRLRGEVVWRRGRITASVPLLRAAAAADPEGPDGLCAGAEAAYLDGAHEDSPRRERHAAAMERLSQALRVRADHARAAGVLGMLLSHSFPRVATLLVDQALLAEGQVDAQLLTWRAFAATTRLRAEGRPLDAVRDDFGRALRLSPGGYHRLGAILTVMELPAHTGWRDGLVEEAERLEPRRGALWQVKGLLGIQSGAPAAEVLACWRRARELEPAEPLYPAWLEAYRRRFGSEPPPEAVPGR